MKANQIIVFSVAGDNITFMIMNGLFNRNVIYFALTAATSLAVTAPPELPMFV